MAANPQSEIRNPQSFGSCLEDNEVSAMMYLADVSMWGEAPEVPSIGAAGPLSRAMTTDMVFHLHLTGHLGKRKPGLWQWLRGLPARLWRRWEVACAPEPSQYHNSLIDSDPD